MATVDKLIVRIEADLKDLKRGLKASERATKNSTQVMNKHFKRVGSSIGSLNKVIFSLKGALVGLGAGAAVRSLIKVGNDVESLQIRFQTLFGSAEEGSKAFDTMAQFASKVPFSLQQIQAGSGSLLAVADDANELGELLEMTGTIAAATGLDFRTASEQIQRSLSAGIGAADLFRDRGVTAMLGFKAGTQVSVEETKEALQKFAKDNEGITDQLANTFSGTLSMIGDKVFTFQRKINDAGFFAELKGRFKELDNFLSNNAEQMDALAKNISDILVKALDGLVFVIKIVAENFDSLLRIAKTFILLKLGSVIVSLSAGFAILAANIIKTRGAMLSLNKVSRRNIFGIMAVGLVLAAEATGQLEKALEAVDRAMKKVMGTFQQGEDLGLGLFGPPKANQLEEVKKAQVRDMMLFGTFTRPDITGTEDIDAERFTREIGNREIGVNPEILERRANAMKRANAEIQKAINLEEKHNQLLKALGINTEGYSDKVDNLKSLLDANKITLKEYHEQLGELRIQLAETSPKLEIFIEGLERTMDSLAQTMADSLLQMGDGWKGFRDSLKNIVRDIIAQLLRLQAQQAITRTLGSIGGSSGGGFDFGKILSIGSSIFGFGGGAPDVAGFANGGSLSPRQPAIVGEKGPELFVPHTSGGIFTNRSLNNMGGGGVSVNQTINIETGVSQTVRAEMLSLLPQIKSETIGAVIDSKKRGGQMAETFS